VIYDAAKLIYARVTHFKSHTQVNIVLPMGTRCPFGAARSKLLGPTLSAGVINPGGQNKPIAANPVLQGAGSTPGMAVEFAEVVANRHGDDVVLFELQRELASPLGGDPFHVSPLVFREGLKSITVPRFDVHFRHPAAHDLATFTPHNAATAPQSLRDLEDASRHAAGANSDFKALAVGIDLSDLGYRDGEQVAGLFIQNVRPNGAAIDPVCIAGLPAPVPPNVLDKEPVPKRWDPQVLKRALAGPLAHVDEVVFAVRVPGHDHWYANFGYYSAPRNEYPPQRAPGGQVKLREAFKNGGRLYKLNLWTKKLTALLDDCKGAVRDPQVHYDGRRILFSYRKGDEPYYNLYEIDADGSNLKQLTSGPHNDIEPTYLPDGGIMFCSDRCNRYVNCWITPVATLHRCDADGSNIRAISTNIEHDNTPWVLPDGRVIYMRWEYVDRSQGAFHHLWTTNPDGTRQMTFYGNMRPGYAMLDAKPIPGTTKVVASFSPGHGKHEHQGHVTIVDSGTGPDDLASARRVSRGAAVFRDPYPFGENAFLVARDRQILVMDGRGRTEELYALPKTMTAVWCHEPRPVLPRPREPVPSSSVARRRSGQLVLQDVHVGRKMQSVRRGEIKKLLVLEQLPKSVNFSGGPWPISNGGTFTLARILGTVPVEDDGSAYLELPALCSIFFVALDEHDLSVKRMHSFLTVQPGEVTSCVGCHEPRETAPLATSPQPKALRRPASRIQPIADVPDVIDFPRDVQPILDRHCVRCHNSEKYAGRVNLTGDHTPLFCESYWAIIQRGLIADGRNAYGNSAPRAVGSSASRLLKKLDGSHQGVRATALEVKTVRLWIESSAVYAGTYAALGSGLFPVKLPAKTIVRRCAGCHGHEAKGRRIAGQSTYFRFGKKGKPEPIVSTFHHLRDVRAYVGYYKFGYARPPQSLCNLSHPAKSPLLRAPLAKAAGGLSLCKGDVFKDTSDADYQELLAAIDGASKKMHAETRFNMPGFRPNDYYLHQMQRYGVIDEVALRGPLDPYTLDRAYWRSFWHSQRN